MVAGYTPTTDAYFTNSNAGSYIIYQMLRPASFYVARAGKAVL